MSAQPAARVEDPIAHSQAKTGMLLGILAGVAVGAVIVGATIATGGAALVVVAAVGGAAGLTSFGGLSGMNIGAAMMGPPTGQLKTGSFNVLVNGRMATMTAAATAICSHHAGPIPLATGSSTVLINGRMAGRLGETMGCSAIVVAQCSPDVLIGGASAGDPDVKIKPEVAPWAVDALVALGLAGAVMALPFAIATVGVAATIAGGVGGFFGGKYAGQAGRALGERLGMSEAGIRAMEAGGQFLGGMAGGWAGMKGTQAGRAWLKPPPKALPDPDPFPYSPKKMGEKEPGAVPRTTELDAQIKAGEAAVGRSAPGYPDLPPNKAGTFGDDVRPWNGDEHPGPIRRVIGSDDDANGGYWQSEIPRTEAEWRGGSAVKNDWNGNGGYVESSPKGLRGWIGPARPQFSSADGFALPGGGEQIWMPPGSASPGPPIPTPWSGK